jgi:UDP-MurNAc hydroxylase
MINYIQLVNHASVFISNGNKSILTDPWYSGDVFDGGWSLLYQNPNQEILEILKKTNFIWISHEHPDHFSVKFLKEFENIIKDNKIIIVFQKTKDRRVAFFLKKLNFYFIELEDNTKFEIDKNFFIKLQRSDFYDSALIVYINEIKIFNLNDCPLIEKKDILNFKKKYGTCDFLFTQFSYAAWKGGKENIAWRQKAAEEKLNTLINQSNLLEAKYVIPFASFIYFSDPYNFYLNDSVNTPLKLMLIKNKLNSKIIFLKPNQLIDLKNFSIKNEGYNFWQDKFSNINNFFISKSHSNQIYNFDLLFIEFQNYHMRLFLKNSIFISKIISKLKFLKIFQPLVINLKDLNIKIKIDLLNKIFKESNEDADIEMNSRSLFLIFTQDFGFDTLTINGCFEELKKNGFVKMTQTLALGNLNNLGVYLNSLIIFNFKIIFIFIKKIISLQKKLSYKYIQSIE